MVFPVLCGFVGMLALYRSLCQPSFLYSRMMCWVAFGCLYAFDALCDDLCLHCRRIAIEQFIASILLAAALVFFHIHREQRSPLPALFDIEAVADYSADVPLCLCWMSLCGSMCFAVHAAWLTCV